MFINYFKIALRNLFRQRTYSLINILGLATGMASAILIMLWVKDEISYDKFHSNKNELYQVSMRDTSDLNDRDHFTISFALAPLLKQEFPEIKDFTRIQQRSHYESCMLKYEDKSFYEDGIILVDPAFFQMFTYQFIKGNPARALQDKNSIVITKDIAGKYFGSDDPLGKTLRFNNRQDFTVSAVIENPPAASELQFDIIAPIQILGDQKLSSWSWESSSYILVQPSTNITALKHKIAGMIQKHHPVSGLNLQVSIVPFPDMHLYHGRGDIRLIYIFISVAIFILLIASINYMNLSTARFHRRAREVGLRKVFGANRGALIRQFFSESIAISLLSLLMASAFVEILLPIFNNIIHKNLTFLTADNSGLLMGLLGLAILVGFAAGCYPAFFLSSFQPAPVLKGLLGQNTKNSRLRTILVVVQFSIAIILIICTLTVYQQHNYMSHKALGYNKDQVIYLPINQEIEDKYEAFKASLLQIPDIKNVTVASSIPGRIGNVNPVVWEGKPDNETVMTCFAVTDRDYMKTFQMKLLAGRDFSREFTADGNNFLINKKAAELMSLKEPVGTQMTFMGSNGKIIGVMDNFHNRPLDQEINPLVLTINPRHYDYFLQYAFIKINSTEIPAALSAIGDISREFAPDYPFEFHFLDQTVDNYYQSVQQMWILFQAFAFLAIFISCLGLFALASFMAELRTKEIGIRKTLGASVSGVVVMLSTEFTKWVLLANIVAWPMAFFAMNKWLQNFAYRISLSWWLFALAGGLAFIIALLTISSQAIKAALVNPVKSLRYE